VGFGSEQGPHALQSARILVVSCLHNQHGPAHLRLDVKLLGPVVNVHQKQVVQKQVLDKVVLVKALLIGHQKVLDLEDHQLADHIGVVASAVQQQNIFQLVLVENLEKLEALDHLAVRRGINEGQNGARIRIRLREGGGQYLSFRVYDTEINSCYSLKPVNRILQYLI